MAAQIHLELARLAAATGTTADRAHDMLHTLRELVPFDAAWIARTDGSGYASLASADLDPAVVRYLTGPNMAHDIKVTGTDHFQAPLSPSDLPYPATELPTWADCLIPAGIHEGLGVALIEPGGRHVGFIALLFGHRAPPTPLERGRLARAAGLLAQGIDPMRSLAAASQLISDAFAGILLFNSGTTMPLPGLRGDELLRGSSGLIRTIRSRLIPGELHMTFLWPDQADVSTRSHVRVSYLAIAEPPFPNLQGIVLLSPAGAVHQLTSRELEVLGMLVDGHSNQQIASRLMVGIRTVAAHVEHILAKLSSPTRTHAAVHAQREGIYVPPAPSAISSNAGVA